MEGENFLTPVATCQVRRATRGAHLTAFVGQKLGAQWGHTGGGRIWGAGGAHGGHRGVQGCARGGYLVISWRMRQCGRGSSLITGTLRQQTVTLVLPSLAQVLCTVSTILELRHQVSLPSPRLKLITWVSRVLESTLFTEQVWESIALLGCCSTRQADVRIKQKALWPLTMIKVRWLEAHFDTICERLTITVIPLIALIVLLITIYLEKFSSKWIFPLSLKCKVVFELHLRSKISLLYPQILSKCIQKSMLQDFHQMKNIPSFSKIFKKSISAKSLIPPIDARQGLTWHWCCLRRDIFTVSLPPFHTSLAGLPLP